MKEKKLEQLRTVFKPMIKDAIKRAKLGQAYFETDEYIQKIVDSLVYEVKIRIKLEFKNGKYYLKKGGKKGENRD